MGSDSLSDGEGTDGSSITSVCTSVSLGKGRGGSVGEGEDSWRVGSIGLARGERVVGVASELASLYDNKGRAHSPGMTH